MINHVVGDLFDGQADVIVHQVNCQGVMGSGFAQKVKLLFPLNYMAYRHVCQRAADNHALKSLLGNALLRIEELNGRTVWIANLFAQYDYGRGGKRYTDYDAFFTALLDLEVQLKMYFDSQGVEPRIAIPYRIGCDRGGGDWDVVSDIIEAVLCDRNVTIYRLPK